MSKKLFARLAGYRFYEVEDGVNYISLIKAKNTSDACKIFNDMYASSDGYYSIDDFVELGKRTALGKLVENYYDNTHWHGELTLDKYFERVFESESSVLM